MAKKATKARGKTAGAERRPSALTPKQDRFVSEYLVDLNATQAAIRSGYSERTAHSQGPRLLENAGIRAEIERRRGIQAERLELRSDRILRELFRIATADIGQAFDERGSLLDVRDMPEDVRRAVAAVKVRVDDDGSLVKELKFWDKNKALESLGRNLKLFTDKVEHDVADGLAERLARARARNG